MLEKRVFLWWLHVWNSRRIKYNKKHEWVFKGDSNSDLLVPAGGFPLTMMVTESSFVRVELKWSVEFTFRQWQQESQEHNRTHGHHKMHSLIIHTVKLKKVSRNESSKQGKSRSSGRKKEDSPIKHKEYSKYSSLSLKWKMLQLSNL